MKRAYFFTASTARRSLPEKTKRRLETLKRRLEKNKSDFEEAKSDLLRGLESGGHFTSSPLTPRAAKREYVSISCGQCMPLTV